MQYTVSLFLNLVVVRRYMFCMYQHSLIILQAYHEYVVILQHPHCVYLLNVAYQNYLFVIRQFRPLDDHPKGELISESLLVDEISPRVIVIM